MGTLLGHVGPGLLFVVIGFWQLFNNIKLYALNPNSYKSLPWFPASRIRYLELLFMMVSGSTYICTELFLGPKRHHPLDLDGTIPRTHLHNFEHICITISIVVYTVFAIILDRLHPRFDKCNLTLLIGAIAFGQEVFLFHFHSTDHVGVEGQYHFMLQILAAICLATTLMGISFPNNFLIGFVRSICILSQGLWFMVMGYMIWTPELLPKGCFLHLVENHKVLLCGSDEALYRAKSLVNILFGFFVIVITIFSVSFYLVLFSIYKSVEHTSLAGEFEEMEPDFYDVDQPQGKVTSAGKFMGKSGFT